MQSLTFVSISNFRPCKSVSLPLGNFTALVGLNNVGKSAILSATQWLLEGGSLATTDFCIAKTPIVAMGRIEGITTDILGKLHPKHRASIEPYCPDGVLWIRREVGNSKDKPELQVWDVDQFKGEAVPPVWKANPGGIEGAIKDLFPKPIRIGAMQDVPDDLCKAKGETIQQLLAEVTRPLMEKHGAAVTNTLRDLHKAIGFDGESRSKELASFDEEATKDLNDFFPGLRLSLDFPGLKLAEFFKADDLKIFEEGTDQQRPLACLGHGAQRSVQMALIKYMASVQIKGQAAPSRRLLLIDEPELYLHPQGVEQLRVALKKLSENGYQVLFSTHSPMMLHREDAGSTVIVRKTKEEGTVTRKPLALAVAEMKAERPVQTRTLFQLGHASKIFFSDRVLIAEGITEERLLPLLHEKLTGATPTAKKLAIVSPGGSGDVAPAVLVLQTMLIDVKAVVDLDFAFRNAFRAGLLDDMAEDKRMKDVKAILKKLSAVAGFPLNGDLPVNEKGWRAADAWAEFAKDADGIKICEDCHNALKAKGIWIWKTGTIEEVLGLDKKGDGAITDAEAEIAAMTADKVCKKFPLMQEFFEWLHS